ncbi:hypothetical protein VTG60DRAFT_6660 [Thermothelomyces hinnuleus]
MSRSAHPFPPPPNAPFLWDRPVCDCHYYYQYYLCGCPDRYVATAGGRLKHIPSRQGCAIWYKPFIERLVHHNAGFRHNPNLPTRPDPSVLPFPCYRHLMESRIFLSPDELQPGRRTPHDHFSSLTWLLEEHSVDLWRQDGYYSRCPPPLPHDVRYDGPTHTGYFAGAYRTDPEVLHQARVASWGREFDELGVWWARRVKELWAEFVEGSGLGAGGGGIGAGFWMGGKLNM